jgi:hypothetical protein
MKQCYDCLAHYSEGYDHRCPPWLKMLVARYRAGVVTRPQGVSVEVDWALVRDAMRREVVD